MVSARPVKYFTEPYFNIVMYFYLYDMNRNVTSFFHTVFSHINGGMKNEFFILNITHQQNFLSIKYVFWAVQSEHRAVTVQLNIANTFRHLKSYLISEELHFLLII